MICIYQLNFSKGAYIGQTTNLKVRLSSHLRKVNCGPKLKQAWEDQNYIGYEVLEECKIDELNAREVYWISIRNPSLNTTAGGKSNRGLSAPRNTLSQEDVEEIVRLLETTELSFIDISYCVSTDYNKTRDICIGKSHVWATEHLDLDKLLITRRKNTILYDSSNTEYIVPYRGMDAFKKGHSVTQSSGWSVEKWPVYEVTDPEGFHTTLTQYQLKILLKENDLPAASIQRLIKGKSSKGWATKKLS